MPSRRRYPSPQELDAWVAAGSEQIANLETQPPEAYQAFLDELETRLTNYEAQFEGPLSSPGGIPRLLRRPLVTIDPDNPLGQEHFVLAAVCLHRYRIPALAFLLVRDVLSYLAGMAVMVPQIDHRAKALEVMQILYDRTMPSLRDSRILGSGPEARWWQQRIRVEYYKGLATMQTLWKRTRRHNARVQARLSALRDTYPDVPSDLLQDAARHTPSVAIDLILAQRYAVSPDSIRRARGRAAPRSAFRRPS